MRVCVVGLGAGEAYRDLAMQPVPGIPCMFDGGGAGRVYIVCPFDTCTGQGLCQRRCQVCVLCGRPAMTVGPFPFTGNSCLLYNMMWVIFMKGVDVRVSTGFQIFHMAAKMSRPFRVKVANELSRSWVTLC